METITAGQAIVNVLKAEGVRCVFGLPGGHILSVYDALYDTPEIKHVLVRHEQAAASMAAAYAQLTGTAGVCLTTAGPGATNLVTGVTEAYVGAMPMVIISARGATNTTHRGAAQEVATERVFEPITKWAVRVDRADLIVDVLRQAFTIARSGKPGPVYIDIPRDLLPMQVPFPPYRPVGRPAPPAGDPTAIAAALDKLLAARRPIIVAGGGTVASGAFAELRDLAERLVIPVLTSLAGRTSIPDDHPLSVGGLGCHRNDLSKRLLPEADVVLGLGTRFEEMETNWRPGFLPAPEACYIQVDTDAGELGRSVVPEIGIVGDVRLVLAEMLRLLDARGHARVGKLEAEPRVKEYAAEIARIEREADATAEGRTPLHAVQVIRAARRVFPRETTVAFDVGCLTQHIAGATPFFKLYAPRSSIVCSSFYGMGFASAGLPAAKVVRPDHPAIGFVGDGSWQMVMNVLPVAVEHALPVTWIVLNDMALGSIWDIQEYAFKQRYIDTEFKVQPDFAKIAEACSCHGETVKTPAEVTPALQRALAANAAGKPAVLDVHVGRDRLQQSYDFFWFYQNRK
jgi:acetolactate synthase-1/2/3 large subunit